MEYNEATYLRALYTVGPHYSQVWCFHILVSPSLAWIYIKVYEDNIKVANNNIKQQNKIICNEYI